MKRVLLTAGLLTLFTFATFASGSGELSNITLEGYSRATDEQMAFDLQWKVDGDVLHVQIAALTTGWVAVGFDPTNKMAGANFLIGYVAGGTPMISDDYGVAMFRHAPDTTLGGEKNISDLEGKEVNGATLLRFTIPLNSGDSYDKPLVPGKTYKVIYAHGSDGADNFAAYHSKNRGSFEITL